VEKSSVIEGGEAKVEEGDEDEYLAPYLAREMSSIGTRTPGDTHSQDSLASGTDEMPSPPQITH
jgi:hypothetical protein